MPIWDGGDISQPFWEREALWLAEHQEPDEVDLAPGTEPPPPAREGEVPQERSMRGVIDSRKAARTLWAEVLRWIQGAQRMIGTRLAHLWILLLASSLAMESAGAQSVVGVVTPPPIAQLEPGDQIKALWDHVNACAGQYRDPAQTFEGLTFFLRDTVYAPSGKLVKGEWSPPGTIYLTVGFENEGWVIAHEMMHHALNGPRGDDPHVPAEPWITCGLLERQVEKAPLVREVMSTTPPPGTVTLPYDRFHVTDPLTNGFR